MSFEHATLETADGPIDLDGAQPDKWTFDIDDIHIDDSDICEDCGNRHGLFCPEMVIKKGDWHSCKGCQDSWTRTRAADSINAVRWSGWLA